LIPNTGKERWGERGEKEGEKRKNASLSCQAIKKFFN
jgi:hypothetical protein